MFEFVICGIIILNGGQQYFFAKLRDTQKDVLSVKYSYLTIFVTNRTKIVNFKIEL